MSQAAAFADNEAANGHQSEGGEGAGPGAGQGAAEGVVFLRAGLDVMGEFVARWTALVPRLRDLKVGGRLSLCASPSPLSLPYPFLSHTCAAGLEGGWTLV